MTLGAAEAFSFPCQIQIALPGKNSIDYPRSCLVILLRLENLPGNKKAKIPLNQ